MRVRTNGIKVKQLRTDRGWKQEELAHRANSTKRTIQRIESGEGAQRSVVGAVATTLGVLVDDLLVAVELDEGISNMGAWPVTLHQVLSGKRLFELLVWATRLKFEHDLDPDLLACGENHQLRQMLRRYLAR